MNFIPERFGDPRTKRAANSSRHQILGDVLVTATAAITAGGLANLRVRTLAKVAGCSVGSILGVFPDLDALTLAVNARTLGEIDRTMAAAGDDDPAEHLVRLSRAYLDYASEHRHRWAALFHHTMPEGQTAPTWYTAQQAASFSHLEAPLARLRAGRWCRAGARFVLLHARDGGAGPGREGGGAPVTGVDEPGRKHGAGDRARARGIAPDCT